MSLLTPRTPLRILPRERQLVSTMTPGVPVQPGDPSGARETGKVKNIELAVELPRPYTVDAAHLKDKGRGIVFGPLNLKV